MGYYVKIGGYMEIPGKSCVADAVAIKPRISELKKRSEKGGAPSGILYTLIGAKERSTEDIVRETKYERDQVERILKDGFEDGWVDKKTINGIDFWSIKNYKIPSKECLMVCCKYRDVNASLRTLEELSDCYNKAYLVFPWEVDREFMDFCLKKGIGILVFYDKIGYFREALPAEWQEITNYKAYSSICENVVLTNFLVRIKETV